MEGLSGRASVGAIAAIGFEPAIENPNTPEAEGNAGPPTSHTWTMAPDTTPPGTAIFSGPAIERITQSALDEVVVTNTIPLSDAANGCAKIRQLSVAPLIAETVQRIAKGDSVMSLFSDQDNLF